MDTTKIIKGVVNSGRYTVTAPIVKEDYGLYLQIEGVELPSTYEVDFSNSEHNGTSVTMIGNSDGVLIPSQFISSGKDVFAFLYHVGADFGRTVYKFRIPNKLRPDRTEETPTPEEQSVIDQAITALNSAVEQTAQDVIDADASAQAARYDAYRAEEARGASLDYAEQAEASATSASQSATASANSATASAQSASRSAQIKADVEGMVDDAQGYAQASAQSASASANSAIQASLSESEAERAKGNAQGYASQAQTSAQTASAKAQDASTSAQTASQKATESAQSASLALGYKNDALQAKTGAETAQGLAESARDSAQGYAEDAQGYAEDAQASAESISASASQIAQNTADILKAFPTDTASGAVASFSDGADNIPLKSLIVNIDPVQDLSQGDPSPENICPISGWTGANVSASGKNFCNATPDNAYTYSSAYNKCIVEDNLVTITGNVLMMFILPVKPSTEYTFSYIASDRVTMRIYEYTDNPRGFIGQGDSRYIGMRVNSFGTTATFFTTNEKCHYIGFGLYSTDKAGVTVTNWQVEIGSISTIYKPYVGQSIPISWADEAGTVYGGKLDVLSGAMRVDRQYVDMGTLTWGTTLYESTFRASITNKGWVQPSINQVTKAICDRYKARAHNNVIDGENGTFFIGRAGVNYIYVKDTNYTDVSAFQSAMNGAQLVVPIITPIEIQLDAHTLSSLLGQNNIWADTGDTMAEYRADTKLYIEKLTQPEEDDMIADSAISEGQFFMIGNSLYRALANIASGATITVDTNAQRVSLSDALNLVNA